MKKNFYCYGFAPIWILLVVALSGLVTFGGKTATDRINNLTKTNQQTEQQLKNSLLYLNKEKLLGSKIEGSLTGTVLLNDGSYSGYKINKADIEIAPKTNNDTLYKGNAEIEFLSKDIGTGNYPDNKINPFYLKDGTTSDATIVDKMSASLLTKDGENIPIRILTGKVRNGVLVGDFQAQTYSSGYILAGTMDDSGNVSAITILSGGKKLAEGPTFIAPKVLGLFKQLELEKQTNVLAATDPNPNLSFQEGMPIIENPNKGTFVPPSGTGVVVNNIGTGGGAGPPGPPGSQGPPGPQGPAGANGLNGVNGVNGGTGPQGPAGADGPAGSSVWGTITGTLSNQSDLNLVLSDKEPTISSGTTSQYWRGDKTFQTLDKNAVGLGNVENTALSTWPGSTNLTTLGTIGTGTWNGTAIDDSHIASANTWNSHITDTNNPHLVTANQVLPSQTGQNGKILGTNGSNVAWITNSSGVAWGAITGTLSDQTDLNTALGGKEPTISSGTTAQYWRGDKTFQTLDANAVGLGNVENTALSTWPGSTNLTTLGTISTGVWNATAIAWNKVDKTGSSLADLGTRSASDLSSGTLSDLRLSTNVTLQGNIFNGANQLVKLDLGGSLPVLNGSALTNLTVPWGTITGTLSNQTDLNSALNGKEPTITAGTTSQYWRGDKTFQTLDKNAVGLGNVENTALSTWSGSTNLTTLGTIGTGVWNGSAIGTSWGGTGLSSIGTANQILGVNTGGTALEYKTFNASNFTVGAGTINTIQGISASASPSFNSLSLTSLTNQLALGTTNTTTISSTAPGAPRIATIPGLSVDDSFVFNNQSAILTNKTIAAGSNTITGLTNSNLSGSAGITNANLANSSITVNSTAGTGISVSGSPVSLGGTLTLAGIDASTTVKGVASFNSTNFSVASGAVNTIQNINSSATPTFASLSLTNTTNQLALGTTNTTTISSTAPSAPRIATIPGLTADDTFAFLNQSQTFTNKTFAAGSNTITGLTNANLSGSAGITNANLANSSITVNATAGTGISVSGSPVSLGGTLTLAGVDATTSIKGVASFNSTNFSVSAGAVNTIQNINSSATPSFAALSLTNLTNQLALGTTNTTTISSTAPGAPRIATIPGLTADDTFAFLNQSQTFTNKTLTSPLLTGNVGIGASNTSFALNVVGSANITNALNVLGNLQVGTTSVANVAPSLLVLGSGTSEPAGFNGATYYNTTSNKFRCFENGAWKNCITNPGSNLQHAATYPAGETNTAVGAATSTLGTVSITPSTTTGDIYVRGGVDIISGSAADQNLVLTLRNGTCAAGTLIATNTINITSAAATFIGSFEISGIVVDAGASAHTLSLCASTATGTTNVRLIEVIADVIDTGADLAEIYTTNDETIRPGDVVSYDSDLKTGMKKSEKEYDPNVFGIVTTKPGLVIGSVEREGVKAMPVALAGRVPVKVSTENGAIKTGDFLTSSSIPGVAMKSTKPGLALGQAITSYEGTGIGEVLVFVKNTYFGGILSPESEQITKQTPTQTPSLDLTVLGQLIAKGALIVEGEAEFKNKVIFDDEVTFNKDAAGMAVIKKDSDRVQIIFEKEYSQTPSVNVSMEINDFNSSSQMFGENYQYVITNKNNKGFMIIINKKAKEDINFSWIVIGSKDTKTFYSEPILTILPTPTSIPTDIPTITTTPIPTLETTATPTLELTLTPMPTQIPTLEPTIIPTAMPLVSPTESTNNEI